MSYVPARPKGMGYLPFPQPKPRDSRGQILMSLEELDRLRRRRRRSWWRTLLWCWALRRRGFWRDRFWRCGSCGRAHPQTREECSCRLLGPYRIARAALPPWPAPPELRQVYEQLEASGSDAPVIVEPRELVRTANGRLVPRIRTPVPPRRTLE